MTEPSTEQQPPDSIARPAQCRSGGRADDSETPFMSTPRQHTWLIHTNCQRTACPFCDGGLSACTVCGGFEGSLTTECCGRRITSDEERRIYTEATLDFKDGQWVNEPNYPRSKHFAGRTGT